MTEILCDWLNKSLELSTCINPENFEKEFANGYLIGEVLHKYELQDDFDRFSKSRVSESKINNFTRIEPVLHLLGVPFDTSTARAIMTEEPGTATRIMYQIFIALENKKKANLTGVAMETMRPAAPAKLQSMESLIYRQRLKQVTPRQTDLNLQELIDRFHQHQVRLEERALKGRIESAEAHRRDNQDKRQKQLDRSKQVQLMQTEQMAKIQAAIVHIPKPPPNRTAAAIDHRRQQRRRLEANATMQALDGFEERLSRTLQPTGESAAGGAFDRPESSASGASDDYDPGQARQRQQQQQQLLQSQQPQATDPTDYIKPASNDAYIAKIRRRLAEDAEARAARERRRRKVLVDCLRAHEQQEERQREATLAGKLMRQSQMERRIAVQLLQARREKDVLKRNRRERERQYQERREIEFQEALDREKIMAQRARAEYEEELQQERLLREEGANHRRQQKYERHYGHCWLAVSDIVDVACKLAELRELEGPGGRVPHRKYRDLKALFSSGQPIYASTASPAAPLAIDDLEAEEAAAVAEVDADPGLVLEEKEAVQDEAELLEYKDMLGEWQPPEDCDVQSAPVSNPVVGWIVDRVHAIANPPTPPPDAPQFPPFPVRATICGKLFSGKSSVVRRLIENNRCVSFDVNTLVEEAMDAFKLNELEPLPTPPPTPPPEPEPEALSGEASASAAPETSSAAQLAASGSTAVADQSAAVSQTNLAAGSSATAADGGGGTPQSQQQPAKTTPPEPPKPQLTQRAKIGEKLTTLLRRGKPVTDELLVELLIEAIHRVPGGTGWILDGFPSNYTQAKLFEKALTGFEEPAKAGARGRKKAGGLASNPKPAPPPPEPASGLDLIIDFAVDDAWCLKRALGRVEQPGTGKEFHLEAKQPPEGSTTGVQGEEKVQPVKDPAFDLDQVQKRLSAYAEAWPKLEKFYRRFGNVVRVDASMEPEAVYLETERILDEFVARRLEAERQEEERKEAEARAAAEALLAEQRRLELEAASAAAAAEAAEEAARASKAASEAEAAAAAAASASRPASGKRKGKAGGSPGRSKSKEKAGSRKSSRASSAEKKGAGAGKARKGSRSGSPKTSKEATGSKPGDSVAPEATSTEAAGEAVPEPPPPPPKPSDPEWEFVDLAIPEDLAKALSPLWDAIEHGYVSTTKSVFRRLRQVKDSAVVYFYQVRRDFLEYLQRPDNHQVLLTAFQKDFNEIPQDLRSDEEVVADLHQRLEELRERLVDITDKRKEQAEAKKEAIEHFGWVEDRLGLLTNLYIELLQGEMDRFQDTVKFMKDYYRGMDTPIPEPYKPDFLRLPILELPYERDPARSGDGSSRGSSRHQSPAKAASPVAKKAGGGGGKNKEPVDEARELTDEEIEAMFRTKIPVLGQAPTLAEFKEALQAQFKVGKEKGAGGGGGGGGGAGGKKDKKAERLETPAAPSDPDARIVFDAFWAGVSQIAFFVSQELAAKEAEEEAERQRLLEKEREREKAVKEAAKGAGKKGGGGAGGGKKGKSRSPSPKKGGKKDAGKGAAAPAAAGEADAAGTPDPAADPLETEEERAKRLTRERMREEYFFSLEHEARAVRARMELCVAVAARVLQDLKQKRELASKDLVDWIGARLLRESELIDQACELIRHAIESRGPIVERLELSASDFLLNSEEVTVLDEEFKVVPDMPKPVRPAPVEQLEPDWFSLKAIRDLLGRFKGIAPDGLLAINEFVNVLMEEVNSHQDPDLLPEQWQHCSAAQLLELAQGMSSDQEYVSWRAFLLAISQPWPWPSQQNLLDTLAKFKDLDQSDSGFVTREQYDFIELWFSPGPPPPTPDEPTKPKQINRLEGFKHLLFDFFANEDGRMPYLDLLLHCAASTSPYVGFLKALSVANDSHIPHCPIAGYEEVTAVDPLAEEVPTDCDDSLVKIDAAYYVLGYGRHITEDTTDFSDLVDTEVTQECLTRPMLGAIYHQLGSDDLDPLPYTRLIKHVSFVELLLEAKQYKRIIVRDFLNTDGRSSRAPSQMQA